MPSDDKIRSIGSGTSDKTTNLIHLLKKVPSDVELTVSQSSIIVSISFRAERRIPFVKREASCSSSFSPNSWIRSIKTFSSSSGKISASWVISSDPRNCLILPVVTETGSGASTYIDIISVLISASLNESTSDRFSARTRRERLSRANGKIFFNFKINSYRSSSDSSYLEKRQSRKEIVLQSQRPNRMDLCF